MSKQQDNQRKAARLQALQQAHNRVQALLAYQQTEEFHQLSAYVIERVVSSHDLDTISIFPYTVGEDPAHVAVRNEMFRAYRDGILRFMTIVAEDAAKLERDIEHLKSD